MFCAKCGARLDEDARFCNKCGNPVSVSADEEKMPAGSGHMAESENTRPNGSGEKKLRKGPLAAVLILAVVLAVGIGIFSYRAAHKEDADTLEATETEDSSAEEVQPETEEAQPEAEESEYASSIAGEEQEENNEDTVDDAALAREAALEQYRQFLQGDLTAEYKGSPVTLNEFYETILIENGTILMENELESFYDYSAPDIVKYALTDIDRNGLWELQIIPAITVYWLIYTAESVDGKLIITEGDTGSCGADSWGTLYSNGLIQVGNGMYTSGHYDCFTSLQGGRIAYFAYLYDEDGYEASESFIEEETETAYKEGYEQVYITHGKESSPSREEYDRMISDFAAEYGGEEAQFYSLEEILNML